MDTDASRAARVLGRQRDASSVGAGRNGAATRRRSVRPADMRRVAQCFMLSVIFGSALLAFFLVVGKP